MKDYKNLIVWQKSMDLVEEVYKISKYLPNEEKFGLSLQLKRAVISIPSNIAEGYERNTTRDYIRFLSIAKASRAEVETQLLICIRLNYVNEEITKNAFSLCNEIKRMMISMIKNINNENI